MSLAIVNLLKLIDSGAIHLIGSLPLEAKTRKEETINLFLYLLQFNGNLQNTKTKKIRKML